MNKLILFLLVLFATPTSAEFYQYRDGMGNLHFTDNLGGVPEHAHLDLKAHYEIPLLEQGDKETDDIVAEGDPVPSGNGTWEEELKVNAESLQEEQASLEKTYEALLSDKNELGEPPPKAARHEDKRTYQSRVEGLNRKITEYEERRKRFEEKVTDFNSRIGGSQ